MTLIKVADQILAQYQYLSGTGLVSEITYGQNLFTISCTYDIFGRVTEIYHGATLAYSYSYNTNGGVDTLTDHKNSRKYLYEYDMYDRATSCKVYSITTGAYLEGSRLGYDKHGRTKWESSYHSEIPATVTNVYTYDSNSNLTNISTSRGDIETGYVYDGFYRLSSESLYRYIGMGGSYSSPTLTRSYSYVLKNGYTTNLIEKLSYSGLSSREFTYSYDSYGNISSAGYNGNTSTYEYDDLGQLTRENNQEAGKTWVYEYDSRGNILSRKTYAYTTGDLGTIQDTDVYTYSGDRLMSYDGSMEFQYDAIGNPTLYFNSRSSGDIYTFTWEEGRQLASGDRSGTSFSYTYDLNGIRTSKTVGDTTYKYYTSGGQLTAMTITVGGTLTATMYFYYNASGIPVALKYNNVVYYYLTNLQGDVVGIVNANGGIVVTYSYDAWGRPLSSTCAGNYDQPLMENNPLRYRGYIYDNETGFYYLESRYYDPTVRRFINADGQLNGGFLGNNLYAYCENNPINRIDPTGEDWWHWALGAAVVAGCAVATVVTCGGFAAAASAVVAVGSGVAATTTASTVAAGAFIGSATVYGAAVFSAASTSSTVREFNYQGNWGTVAATVLGGLTGGYDGYTMSKAQSNPTVTDDEPFLPDSFYSKHAPKQSTPNSSYTNYTYNNYTGKYEKSTAYYDFAGRQNIRIDWTNHGYSNHGNPHVHYTTYNSQYRDGFTIRWD